MAKEFLHQQADSFFRRALELEVSAESIEPRLAGLYRDLAGFLYSQIGLSDSVHALPTPLLASLGTAETSEQTPMSYRHSNRFDPCNNETELLKQITLFQRKADAVAQDASPYKRAMRSIYMTIIGHCRESLGGLQPNPPQAATGTNG